MKCTEVKKMLFSEIYGTYFNTVAGILKEAVKGTLTQQRMYEIIEQKGFGESMIRIPEALTSREWPLVSEDWSTPLKHEPAMPLTQMQRRWMKALLEDPRIKLFDVSPTGLDDVEPLFRPDTVVYFDQYSDGDPYEDEGYIKNFRTILTALKESREIEISFTSRKGLEHHWICRPAQLEYSLKDDKFRLRLYGGEDRRMINLARIRSCSLGQIFDPDREERDSAASETDHVILELKDERNALERFMLHFSHLKKETRKLDDGRFMVKLYYDKEDRTEMLIRILSFGPVVKVTEPESFIDMIRERLETQRQCSQLF